MGIVGILQTLVLFKNLHYGYCKQRREKYNMIRKRIAVLLTMIMLCLNVQYVICADENVTVYTTNNGIQFIYDNINNKLEIKGEGSAYVEDISTVIGDKYQYLKEVVVDEGITHIPLFVKETNYKTEGSNQLEKVTLPSTVTIIPGGAFYGCSSLKEVNGLENITQVGNYAFYGTAISDICFGDSLAYIGFYAFADCSSLVSVELGNGLKSIDSTSFSNSFNIEKLKIGNMSSYDELVGVFDECNKLYDSNGSLVIDNVLIGVKSTGADTFTIPEGVKKVAERCFYYNKEFKKIVIASTVETIGSCAFLGSTVESVNLPSGIKTIEDYAFSYCDSLKSINLPSGIKKIGNGAFRGCSELESVDFKINTSLCTVGFDIFTDCEKLANEKGAVVINGLLLGDIYDSYYDEASGEQVNNVINITKDVTEIFVNLLFWDSDIKLEDGQKNFVWDNGSLYSSDYTTLYSANFEENEAGKQYFVVKDGCKKIASCSLTHSYYDSEITIPASVTNIYDGEDIGDSLTIKGTANSYANQYATWYGLDFVATEGSNAQEATVPPGDVDGNGVVNLLDTKIVLKVALGIDKCTDTILAAGDVDSDNKVTLLDAKIILKVSLGITKIEYGGVSSGANTKYTFPEIRKEEYFSPDSSLKWGPYGHGWSPSTSDQTINTEIYIALMFGAVGAVVLSNRKKRRA